MNLGGPDGPQDRERVPGGAEATPSRGERPTIWTIGHSNQPVLHLIELLEANGIEVLVDARTSPYSRWATQFNRPDLEAALAPTTIRYAYRGDTLGGRPDGSRFYDAEGHVLYSEVAQAEYFRDAIAKLVANLDRYRVAIMCSEEDPTDCHRRLLIGRVLAGEGVDVLHIRGDGTVETEDDIARRAGERPDVVQLTLDPEAREEKPWRSIRSVSRNTPPRPSSEP